MRERIHQPIVLLCAFYICLVYSSCAPKALFEVQKESSVVPTNISLKNLSKNSHEYIWEFSDGSTSTEVNPTLKLTKSGLQTIRLTSITGNKKASFQHSFYLDAPDKCTALIKTNLGDMTVVLYDATPIHQENFIKLVKSNFYNNISFHRVISGFVAQVGDPSTIPADKKSLNKTNPNYTLPAEIIDTMFHIRGTLAAARTPDEVNPRKESSGTQFYIIDGRKQSESQIQDYGYAKGITYPKHIINEYIKNGGSPQLDGEYTIFGKVVSGFHIIEAIMEIKTDEKDRPIDDITILEITMVQ
jgi:cyclophilin family peptidyl-prolyl cis-trans isomerase